jgi:signal transduction histidine kinase
MLRTVLSNLVGNAIRYTERGGVLVGWRRRGGRVAIQIVDTGIGIPADRLESIFDEFRQLQPGRGEGMGLGLWIVKRTVQMMGAKLAVRSAVGRGSCFAVEVPLAGALAVPEPAMAGNKPRTARVHFP